MTAAPDRGEPAAVPERAFPLIFAERVSDTAAFYEKLGFTRHSRNPPTGEPTYVGLRRGTAEIAVVNASWPADQYGGTAGGQGLRFEMFVLVGDLDTTLEKLAADGTPRLRGPVDMPWGERIAYVADPDGNPVALASSTHTA
ncbi:VOC family protein [Streptomyces sp. NPDC088762]|uniref:VOC family protein n=1 Tax=Streptomyces sp. NPDC088762 TaxID=3365891 RepID=UPI003808A6DE